MIDWNEILKIGAGVAAAFGGGWATAVIGGQTGTKAIASGIATASTYYLGLRQDKPQVKV